jgi:drug/metabolite transporter (DMT)-like permease
MITSPIATSTSGLSAAASWGAADFSGGIASRRSDSTLVVAVVHGVGLVFTLLLALAVSDPFPDRASILWGLAAGVCGGVGLALFYRALAIGQIGVVAPVAAVLTTSVPVLIGLHESGRPSPLQAVGFVLALLGIWLVAWSPGAGKRPRGIGLAAIAAVGFAAFLVFSKYATTRSLLWPLVATRCASVLVMVVILSARKYRGRPGKSVWVHMIIAGVLDAGGSILYIICTRYGGLAPAAVLSSFYPVVTTVMARVFLKERMSLLQGTGIAAALIAVPLIAGG